MRSVLASLPLLVLACGSLLGGCGPVATTEAAPRPSRAPVLPRLVTEPSNHVRLDVRINDLLVTQTELSSIVSHDHPMPAMYFLPGANTARIRYTADPSTYTEKPPTLVVKLSEIDEANPVPYGLPNDKRVFAQFPISFDACSQGHTGPACEQSVQFEIAGKLPTWRWTTGEPITDTPKTREELVGKTLELREQLLKMVPRDEDGLARPGNTNAAGVRALRKKLVAALADQQASARLAGKAAIPDLEDLLALAANPNASVDEVKNLDQLELDIFGGGKLARLRTSSIPLLWLSGGAHDAPSGRLGPFSISFDLWWGKHNGRWQLAAIWRTGPQVTLPPTRR